MNVIISCVFLFEMLGFMLAIVCAHVWSMQMCARCPLKQLSYTSNVTSNNVCVDLIA